jgi:hypothetical protein
MSKGYVRGGESMAKPKSKLLAGSSAGGVGGGGMMVEIPELEGGAGPAPSDDPGPQIPRNELGQPGLEPFPSAEPEPPEREP